MPETVLFIAYTEGDGSFARPALEALTAARELGRPLAIGLIGANTAPAAEQVGGTGARLLAVSGEAFGQPRYATDAAAAEAVCRAANATVVVAPGTSRCMRVLPGVSHRLGGQIDTHVANLQAGPTVTRWYYRQRIEAVLDRSHRPWFLAVDSGAFPAYSGPPAAASVENIAVDVAPELTRTAVLGKKAPKTGQQTIRPDAKVLFVAGAGWTKKQKNGTIRMQEAAGLIIGFVNQAQASLGSSKSLVDLSGEGQDVLPFLSHLNQVGQTGSTPRHPKGLATCCHGEEPHVVGWRFIKERRAVNLDANCGWARGKADVLYVADAFEVMTKVNELLAEKAVGAAAS
jgi:electron transfer flavoprotein alpha subunit